MEFRPVLDPESEIPLYRQLSAYFHRMIASGEIPAGEKLPAHRELATQLALNRTTVSAAYELLESEGKIKCTVGRGSYVAGNGKFGNAPALDWSTALTPSLAMNPGSTPAGAINFTTSRPSDKQFPMEEFRTSCHEVLDSKSLKTLMQLGSSAGYEPLRHYLLERAISQGFADESDDILITNGCQQAFDLLRRALVRPGVRVAMEEPVYPGLRNLFQEAGADLTGVRMSVEGMEPHSLQRALDAGAKLVMVTPSFQNPTGATLSVASREAIAAITRAAGAVVIESDIYSELLYTGTEKPKLKQLDPNVILVGSFSKIAFPGIRVGWIIAKKPVIQRATALKQLTDLHTDHLSQAFLLHFAESGRLAEHREHAIASGRAKLHVLDQACRKHLTGCTWTLPSGGMNIWIDLPRGLDAVSLRGLAQQAGVDYLPGRYFSLSRALDSGLRLSFAGLEPNEIRKGIELLGSVIRHAAVSQNEQAAHPSFALV